MKKIRFFLYGCCVIALAYLLTQNGRVSTPPAGLSASARPAVHELPMAAPDARRGNSAVAVQDDLAGKKRPQEGPGADVVGTAPDIQPESPDVIPNEHILSFADTADREMFARLAEARGLQILGRMQLGNTLRLRVDDPAALQELLEHGPAPIEYGPNHAIRLPRRPEELPRPPAGSYAAFGDSALERLGVQGPHANWGAGIKVAVLDTGVAPHPALSEPRIKRRNFLEEPDEEYSDYGYHGTAVASIIAGTSSQLTGIAPAAEILSMKVLSDEGMGDTFTLAQAIVDSVDRGARIINMSLGTQSDSPVLRQAVQYARDHDVALVAATGNDSVNAVSYPARYKGVISVAAVDAVGRHLYFSNRGPEVDIAAPGLGVEAALADEEHGSFSGTSAAAPFVSGALAWIMAEQPDISTDDAVALLSEYADDIERPGSDETTGSGMLNIQRIRERDNDGIYDVAVLAPYIPSAAEDSDRIEVVVAAQNRGTEYLDFVDMSVDVEGTIYAQTLYNIAVGETVSHVFSVPNPALQQSGSIGITYAATISGEKDRDAANNNGRWNIVPRPNSR
ncbi:MAG: S8 family serine peptidase [Deltaproteobacteria bacterium]|nr:S8 family serine peptidase [Deltaproteobacteria bacterium]